MHFATLQCLQTPENIENFDSGRQEAVLGLYIGDGLSLFFLVHPADFDSMGLHNESAAFNTCFASNNSCPCRVLLPESLSCGGVGSDKHISTCQTPGSSDFARLSSPGLFDGLYN